MATMLFSESVVVKGSDMLDTIKGLIREGNVRRIVVRQADQTVAEFPLTVGVVGTMLAPVLAAVGALVALLADCTIEVERVASADGPALGAPPAEADEALDM